MSILTDLVEKISRGETLDPQEKTLSLMPLWKLTGFKSTKEAVKATVEKNRSYYLSLTKKSWHKQKIKPY